MRIVAVVLGVALLIGTTSSVIRTIIVPRGLHSVIAGSIAGAAVGSFDIVVRRIRSYPRRDTLLAWLGPLMILGVLICWLILYWASYAMLVFGIDGDVGWDTAFRESGSSLFTLGYAAGGGAPLTALDFAAAATGPILIGLMIGYLPTLYGAFNRREVEVTQLGWLAGEPNWGPELLARQATLETLGDLPDLWRTWTVWAADVSESHSTNPVLVAIRSTRPRRNWAVALLAVMDAAALQLAVMPQLPAGRARLLLRQGTQCLESLSSILGPEGVELVAAEGELVLTRAEFDAGLTRMRAAGVPMTVSADEAWEVFTSWRRRYESLAVGLCQAISAVPSYWSGSRVPETPPVHTPEYGSIRAMGPAHIHRHRRADGGVTDAGTGGEGDTPGAPPVSSDGIAGAPPEASGERAGSGERRPDGHDDPTRDEADPSGGRPGD